MQVYASERRYACNGNRDPHFDEATSTARQGGGPTAVQLALDRPLRSGGGVPGDTYAKTGLCTIAFEDTTVRGGCVLNQLILAINHREDKRKRKNNAIARSPTPGTSP